MLGYVSSFFRSWCNNKTSKEAKEVEGKNFTGLKLTMTSSNFFLSGNAGLTSRGKLTFINKGAEEKNYIIGVRCGDQDYDSLKTAQERVESFDKFVARNKESCCVVCVDLYNHAITMADFDKFVQKFEKDRGKDQTKGYDPLLNNCAGSTQRALHYFFKDKRVYSLYMLLKCAPWFFLFFKSISNLGLLGLKLNFAAYLVYNAVSGVAGSIATGCMPFLMPSPAVLPNELSIEGRLYTLFGYNKPFAYISKDSQAAADIELGTVAATYQAQKLQHG